MQQIWKYYASTMCTALGTGDIVCITDKNHGPHGGSTIGRRDR